MHHYYGPNLIKILFSTFQLPHEQILRSRYHHEFPITAKDPLTNEVIVGEVSFYLLENGAQEATFFGSDFNYASSKLFRDKFKEYTVDPTVIDLGYREQASENNNEQAQPNLIEPAVPLHYTDKEAFR